MSKRLLISEEEKSTIFNLYNILSEEKPTPTPLPKYTPTGGYKVDPNYDSQKEMSKIGAATTYKMSVDTYAAEWCRNNNVDTDSCSVVFCQKNPSKCLSMVSHDSLMVAQIVSAFIPVVGPLLSAGFGFADAGLYFSEGKNKEAGMSAMFASLPVIGPIVSKIPIIKTLGNKGMKFLSDKLIKFGNKAKLTPEEAQVVKGLSEEVNFVTQELSQYSKNLAKQALKTTTNNSSKQLLKKSAVGGLKFGGTMGAYYGAGVAYDKTYDYFNPNEQQFGNLKIDMNAPVPEKYKNAAAEIDWEN